MEGACLQQQQHNHIRAAMDYHNVLHNLCCQALGVEARQCIQGRQDICKVVKAVLIGPNATRYSEILKLQTVLLCQ